MPLLFLATIEVVDLFVGLTVLRANSEEGCITSALLCSRKLAQAHADVAWCRPERCRNMSENVIPLCECGAVQIAALII